MMKTLKGQVQWQQVVGEVAVGEKGQGANLSADITYVFDNIYVYSIEYLILYLTKKNLMKNLFSTILLLLFSSIVSAQSYDTLITPISADMLQDANVSSDVFSILNGTADENLYAHKGYKLRSKRHLLYTSLKGYSDFFLSFSEPLQKTKEKRAYQTSCSSSLTFISHLGYIDHGKGGPYFTTRALSAINQEIVSAFSGQSIRCIVKAYRSKDHHKNYCHLQIESDSKKLDYIFIIKSCYFYQCVVRKNI